ncbi:DUF3263 domain-containing protein [Cumulibacter soli]|uniref:DUF3263 domain-containing protein n=1 Tax=Cumulibacter soli TaxID=2546344 RepID=UPI001067C3CB|nr:DUF3263 domain-containing protein [Cumulibacter soli]
MTHWHPWRALRNRADIDIVWTRGEGSRTIWHDQGVTIEIDTTALQATRRCVAAHELIHIERGIPTNGGGVLAAREERRVDAEAARRLIPIDRLAHALAWSTNPHEAAEELWVHPHVLSVRLATLTDDERDHLAGRGAILDLFDMSAVRYYQRLLALVTTREAIEHDPMLCSRVRRQAAHRQRARNPERVGLGRG